MISFSPWASCERGIEFLYVPGSYYDTVSERVGEINEDLAILKSLRNSG
jgi:4-hydroxyphenylpyruvate dioxygenase